MNNAKILVNDGKNGRSLGMTGGVFATARDGSIEIEWSLNPKVLAALLPVVWVFGVLRGWLRNTYCWLGVGRADEYEELAKQYRACSVGIDTCSEGLRNDDQL